MVLSSCSCALQGIEGARVYAVHADLLSINIFLTRAGTRDEGGVVQPAYINFEAELLRPSLSPWKVDHDFLIKRY